MAFTEDLTAFFNASDFAVTAVFGAESAQVILDRPDLEIMAGRVQSTEYLMTYPATVFSALADGDSITIDGSDYSVREVRALDDGRIKQAIVEAA